MRGRICQVIGCDKPHKAHGYCSMHSRRWERHGDPLYVKSVGRPRAPDHGTVARYKAKCRCTACVTAKFEADRQQRRMIHPLIEVRRCLIAFGISEDRIAEIGADALEHHHWALWRVHGPFRVHCACELPAEIVEELQASLEAV